MLKQRLIIAALLAVAAMVLIAPFWQLRLPPLPKRPVLTYDVSRKTPNGFDVGAASTAITFYSDTAWTLTSGTTLSGYSAADWNTGGDVYNPNSIGVFGTITLDQPLTSMESFYSTSGTVVMDDIYARPRTDTIDGSGLP